MEIEYHKYDGYWAIVRRKYHGSSISLECVSADSTNIRWKALKKTASVLDIYIFTLLPKYSVLGNRNDLQVCR